MTTKRARSLKPNDMGYVKGYGYVLNEPDAQCGSDGDAGCFKCGRCQHEGITIFGGVDIIGAACQDCIEDAAKEAAAAEGKVR